MTSVSVECPNISHDQRRRRLVGGLIALSAAAGLLAYLTGAAAVWWWRAALSPLWLFAAFGWFQWQDHTCVALAAQGKEHLDGEAALISNPRRLEKVMRQSRLVLFKAISTGVVLTGVGVALPLLFEP